ncbi:hypothetical protein NSU_1459 [Novosphingobium pentaromativorans US6-1]|uniref:Uncharacterized protein n=1 Tax=Novosphingobium pentaromativorans US6-1 TaxID=1088721 RepID=G6EAR1_9SPHN|nr:hypothetical protein NSU_1459 [Novosphingobium pentaromativorans US6-1]
MFHVSTFHDRVAFVPEIHFSPPCHRTCHRTARKQRHLFRIGRAVPSRVGGDLHSHLPDMVQKENGITRSALALEASGRPSHRDSPPGGP